MNGLEEVTPIALMKIEGQLGHLNATLAAQLELEVLKNKYQGEELSEKLEGFYRNYIDTRKEVDNYISSNLSEVLSQEPQSDPAEDIIAKLNSEKE